MLVRQSLEERRYDAALMEHLSQALSKRAGISLRVSARWMAQHGTWSPPPLIGSVRLEVKTRLQEAYLTGRLER